MTEGTLVAIVVDSINERRLDGEMREGTLLTSAVGNVNVLESKSLIAVVAVVAVNALEIVVTFVPVKQSQSPQQYVKLSQKVAEIFPRNPS